MPNDATPIPHPPSAAETATRAALDWVKGLGFLQGDLLAAVNTSLTWNADAGWLNGRLAEGSYVTAFLVSGGVMKFRLLLDLLEPRPMDILLTIPVPAHVFAAGD